MGDVVIVSNTRAEHGPLESVIAALPEARVIGFSTASEPHISMGGAIIYFTTQLENIKPKLVLLLGDRYETLSAALAATFLRIPIAHIHGGETTTGAFDDAMRHSITHLTEQSGGLHFVATQDAADRVFNLRCAANYRAAFERIHLVGAPGLDGVAGNSAQRDRKLVLVTYHPETRAADYGVAGCKAMLESISSELLGYEIVFCGVNNDPGSAQIQALIKNHCNTRGGRIEENLSHSEYVELMQHAALVIGNSSAGVIEAPWIGVPSVNIGNRQNGRPMAPSVFQATPDKASISQPVQLALNFRGTYNPCYTGDNVGVKIADVVREFLSRAP